MYDRMSDTRYQEGRDQVNPILMEDFNTIVGQGSTNKVVGPFGLSRRNERDKEPGE